VLVGVFGGLGLWRWIRCYGGVQEVSWMGLSNYLQLTLLVSGGLRGLVFGKMAAGFVLG